MIRDFIGKHQDLGPEIPFFRRVIQIITLNIRFVKNIALRVAGRNACLHLDLQCQLFRKTKQVSRRIIQSGPTVTRAVPTDGPGVNRRRVRVLKGLQVLRFLIGVFDLCNKIVNVRFHHAVKTRKTPIVSELASNVTLRIRKLFDLLAVGQAVGHPTAAVCPFIVHIIPANRHGEFGPAGRILYPDKILVFFQAGGQTQGGFFYHAATDAHLNIEVPFPNDFCLVFHLREGLGKRIHLCFVGTDPAVVHIPARFGDREIRCRTDALQSVHILLPLVSGQYRLFPRD